MGQYNLEKTQNTNVCVCVRACVRESDTVQPYMLGGKIWFLVCDIMMACGRESEIFS